MLKQGRYPHGSITNRYMVLLLLFKRKQYIFLQQSLPTQAKFSVKNTSPSALGNPAVLAYTYT